MSLMTDQLPPLVFIDTAPNEMSVGSSSNGETDTRLHTYKLKMGGRSLPKKGSFRRRCSREARNFFTCRWDRRRGKRTVNGETVCKGAEIAVYEGSGQKKGVSYLRAKMSSLDPHTVLLWGRKALAYHTTSLLNT